MKSLTPNRPLCLPLARQSHWPESSDCLSTNDYAQKIGWHAVTALFGIDASAVTISGYESDKEGELLVQFFDELSDSSGLFFTHEGLRVKGLLRIKAKKGSVADTITENPFQSMIDGWLRANRLPSDYPCITAITVRANAEVEIRIRPLL